VEISDLEMGKGENSVVRVYLYSVTVGIYRESYLPNRTTICVPGGTMVPAAGTS